MSVYIEGKDLHIIIEDFSTFQDGDYQLVIEKKGENINSTFNHLIYTGSKSEEEELERRITDILKALGIPSHLDGYRYLRILIRECYYNPKKASTFYPMIIAGTNNKKSSVIKIIRDAIATGFNRCNLEVRHRIFGYTIENEKGSAAINHFVSEVVIFIREKRELSEIV